MAPGHQRGFGDHPGLHLLVEPGHAPLQRPFHRHVGPRRQSREVRPLLQLRRQRLLPMLLHEGAGLLQVQGHPADARAGTHRERGPDDPVLGVLRQPLAERPLAEPDPRDGFGDPRRQPLCSAGQSDRNSAQGALRQIALLPSARLAPDLIRGRPERPGRRGRGRGAGLHLPAGAPEVPETFPGGPGRGQLFRDRPVPPASVQRLRVARGGHGMLLPLLPLRRRRRGLGNPRAVGAEKRGLELLPGPVAPGHGQRRVWGWDRDWKRRERGAGHAPLELLLLNLGGPFPPIHHQHDEQALCAAPNRHLPRHALESHPTRADWPG
mmetsp:Transcript_11396/g.28915  ORF Transcript_11396/g.28915 Transcript_11396/m.28915 type:complete len:323 (-) Transcript_11396:622-1590(-)